MLFRSLQPTEGEPSLAEKYASRAQHLLLSHLALPTIELVYTLVLLAYNEFAGDRDSGLWIWTGMAIRMSYDCESLGDFRQCTIAETSLRAVGLHLVGPFIGA